MSQPMQSSEGMLNVPTINLSCNPFHATHIAHRTPIEIDPKQKELNRWRRQWWHWVPPLATRARSRDYRRTSYWCRSPVSGLWSPAVPPLSTKASTPHRTPTRSGPTSCRATSRHSLMWSSPHHHRQRRRGSYGSPMAPSSPPMASRYIQNSDPPKLLFFGIYIRST